MKRIMFYCVTAVIAGCLGVSACSRSSDVESQPVKGDPASEAAAKQIRKTLRSPIDKAQHTHELGDERTNAMDEAVKQQN
jgi:hypothetical protein